MSDSVPFRDPLAAKTRFEDGLYRMGEVVGEGSFSLTYAGRQGKLDLPVAIKEFFPQGCWREDFYIKAGPPWHDDSFAEALEAFVTEGATLKRFRHPGIVRVLGAFRANGTAYLVEELLEGATLMENLARLGAMSLNQVLEVARQLGEAILQVHAVGLVHADLKPDNVFATNAGQYVLLDFATARNYNEGFQARGGLATVSPGYSPLEQYTRDQQLAPAADVYALAATLYCLLQGAPPPPATERLRGAPLQPLRGEAVAIQSVLLEALHLHPLRRTPSVAMLLEQLGVPSTHASIPSIREFEALLESYAHPGGVYALALHSQAGILCSAGRDGCFRLWSWPECQLLRPQKVVSSAIKAVALASDGQHLVTGAQDGSIRLWSIRDKTEGPWLVREGPAVVALRFAPGDHFVVAGLADGTCRLLGPGLQERHWQASAGAVQALDVHLQDGVLVCAGSEPGLNLWALPEALGIGQLPTSESVSSIRFHPDGNSLLICCRDLTVVLWEWGADHHVRSFPGHRAEVWDAQFTADPNLIVTVSADHYLYGFSSASGRPALGSPVPEGLTGALAVDPQRRLLVTGGSDGLIRLWGF